MNTKDIQETLTQQKRAKKLAYFLAVYTIVITATVIYMAAIWIGIKVTKTDTPACESAPVTIEETKTTIASWYDYELAGVTWSEDHRTAASREFERGIIVEVTNSTTGRMVIVLINDYGPDEKIHPDRSLDLSSYAFAQIADLQNGLVEVEYREIGPGEYHPL